MIDFIIKYWVEVLFSGFLFVLGFLFKRFVSLEKKRLQIEIQEFKNEILDEVNNKVSEEHEISSKYDQTLEKMIGSVTDVIDNLRQGLLSIQGKQFKDHCEYLLQDGYYITTKDYERFENEYSAYKALKGNHEGDTLHDAVVVKFNAQLTK